MLVEEKEELAMVTDIGLSCPDIFFSILSHSFIVDFWTPFLTRQQLTNALLEMEEEKAIWFAKEKASVEAIEERAKLYNAETMSLSKGLLEVTFKFKLGNQFSNKTTNWKIHPMYQNILKQSFLF